MIRCVRCNGKLYPAERKFVSEPSTFGGGREVTCEPCQSREPAVVERWLVYRDHCAPFVVSITKRSSGLAPYHYDPGPGREVKTIGGFYTAEDARSFAMRHVAVTQSIAWEWTRVEYTQ